MPAMLKQPIVVILFKFFVSVTTTVKDGSRPINKTTTAGKTVKATIIRAIKSKNFWIKLSFLVSALELFLDGVLIIGFVILSPNKVS